MDKAFRLLQVPTVGSRVLQDVAHQMIRVRGKYAEALAAIIVVIGIVAIIYVPIALGYSVEYFGLWDRQDMCNGSCSCYYGHGLLSLILIATALGLACAIGLMIREVWCWLRNVIAHKEQS
jgi:hypothetical protein